jgi:aminoglycoside phosphotransferase (APT) family kinase protein
MLSAMLGRPWRIFPLARRFGEIHAQIHQIEAPHGEGEVPEAVASRLDQLEASDAWLRDWARRELEQLPRDGALLHGDYHPLNLLMEDSNPVVIDWPGASAGPPEADIAQTLVLIKASDPPNRSPLILKLLRALRTRLFMPLYLRGCRRVGEFDRELVNRWRMVRPVERLAVAPANEERALRRMIRESGGPRDFGPT